MNNAEAVRAVRSIVSDTHEVRETCYTLHCAPRRPEGTSLLAHAALLHARCAPLRPARGLVLLLDLAGTAQATRAARSNEADLHSDHGQHAPKRFQTALLRPC